MALAAVEALLSRKIGLDPASVGSGAIARCVRHRMAARGLADPDAYAGLLQASEAELEELAEEVIVPETWFFRDREPFRLLGKCAVSEWLPANPGGVFRALSVPCSTGEEPYSVAMTLLDAGLAPGGFHIDAVDLSKRALSAARRAVYGRNSFRGEDLSFRDGHFERTEEGWRLLAPARTSVQFVQGNLLNSPFLLTAAPYDAILCRNLLIYFGREARERTIQVLYRLLKPSGLLLVGHAEPPQLWGERFVPVRHPGAFACRKRDGKQVASRESNVQGQRSQAQGPGPKMSPGSRVQGPASKPLTSDSGLLTLDSGLGGADDTERPSLEVVARLADEGRLEEAAALCESYLRENSPHARAFFLLGLIRQASGDDQQAETSFNRAVYLEPDHEEALVHLALLAERRGDRAGAARFRQRYQRVQGHESRVASPKTG